MELRLNLGDEAFYKLALHARALDTTVEVLAGTAIATFESSRSDLSRGMPLFHKVARGDTLGSIAKTYLGDPNLWHQVQGANRRQVPDADAIVEGQLLVLPEWAPKRWWKPVDYYWDSHRYYQFGDKYVGGPYDGLPHPGIDIPGALGAPVYAIGDGRVIVNKDSKSGYGHYLMIEHEAKWPDGSRFSLYAHLERDSHNFITPPVGTIICGNKTRIGCLGRTGTDVSHLHLEIKLTEELGLYGTLPAGLSRYWVDPRTIESEQALYMPW